VKRSSIRKNLILTLFLPTEAFNFYRDMPMMDKEYSFLVLSSWGTADPEVREKLVGYEKKTEKVKISDAIYEWKH
jgi:hypothetical protein